MLAHQGIGVQGHIAVDKIRRMVQIDITSKLAGSIEMIDQVIIEFPASVFKAVGYRFRKTIERIGSDIKVQNKILSILLKLLGK